MKNMNQTFKNNKECRNLKERNTCLSYHCALAHMVEGNGSSSVFLNACLHDEVMTTQ